MTPKSAVSSEKHSGFVFEFIQRDEIGILVCAWSAQILCCGHYW